MNLDAASCYQLNINQFNSLFTEEIAVGTIESLSKSAADGHLDSIDMLHNLALRQDTIGKRAENTLFDLFSGKTPGKMGVDRDIQQASLALYQTACSDKNRGNDDMHKLYSPSKLLYMAGSAVTGATQKQNLSLLFMGNQCAQSQYEQTAEQDLWSSNRMLTTDDIDAAMRNLTQQADNLSINFPIGLVHPDSNENILDAQIEGKISNPLFLAKPEYFPVNTGNHWVLFGLYQDKDRAGMQTTKAIVFNSAGELDSDTKNKLSHAANIAGAADDRNITFVEQNIQDNVPNGCGIFVIKAMSSLVKNPNQDPVNTLKTFVEDFAQSSVEKQTTLNTQFRRQLYEHCML